VVLAALGWVTLLAIERDRAEAHARRQAALEENVRLALWRMDSAMAPLVAAENARPPESYMPSGPAPSRPEPRQRQEGAAAFDAPATQATPHPADAAAIPFSQALLPPPVPAQRQGGPTGQPIPLRVVCYFQLQDGIVSLASQDAYLPLERREKPAAPPDSTSSALQPAQKPTPEPAALAEREQAWFQDLLARPENWENLPRGSYPPPDAANESGIALGQQETLTQADAQQLDQTQRGAKEYVSRAKLLTQNLAPMSAFDSEKPDAAVAAGPLEPMWIEGQLVLARWVRLPRGEAVQGCWLDWAAVRDDLLALVRDLLPQADLVPARSADAATRDAPGALPPQEQSRLMATLPVRLIPGPLPVVPAACMTPLAVSLILAWAAALVAAIAVAFLLAGVVSLSERRAAFVGAVTHELRTPLTTFRMYAEMLAEGMVSDKDRQRRYLETLLGEAERLSHLVENVLAYARLERGRHAACRRVGVGALLSQVVPRLQLRAAAAGRVLHVEVHESAQEMAVLADACAVEQILFNLVDNACKYGVDATDNRIHLEARREGASLHVRVRDHGPGFCCSSSRRLFKPFSKSAHDAARTAPGVGLGLALCRRLARGMRGDLYTEQQPSGACVVLRLRMADAAAQAETA
jgi:signal transduction histidine kinase